MEIFKVEVKHFNIIEKYIYNDFKNIYIFHNNLVKKKGRSSFKFIKSRMAKT